MNEELKKYLIKRLKSLSWRAFVMLAVGLIALLIETVGKLNVSPFIVTIIGLLGGEATKWLNDHTDIFGARLKSQPK